jgi:rhodanese-related sulfurtransferase
MSNYLISNAMNRRIEKGIKEVDAATAYEKIKNGAILMDVRELEEIEQVAFGVENILVMPVSEFGARLDEIPRDKEVIIGCRSGSRSFQVTWVLSEQNFDNVINLKNGIINWAQSGLPIKVRETAK